MSTSTQLETINKAKTPHRCSWCSERIDVGQPYKRYRCYNYGAAATVKLHPECYDAMKEAHANEGAGFEFSPGDNPRGCICGHSIGCTYCEARKVAA